VNNRRARARAKWAAGFVLVLILTLLSGTTSFSKPPPQKYPLGDIPLDEATYQKYLKKLPLDMAEALPTSYDARDFGFVTSAKDQGNCGSCWAFAAVGGMESHMLKAFGVGPEDLSEQQQVSCNTSMSGCNGGSATAIRYWENKGPVGESYFPYTADDGTPCKEAADAQLDYRVVDYHTVPNSTAGYKSSLYTYGPSYWRFTVYDDFFTFWNEGSDGQVYMQSSGSLAGGHAVLLIGWDDSKGAFLCKNSWGEDAGPNGNGTFWIAYTGHLYNLNFGMSNFSLTGGCVEDADCNDGLSCNCLLTCVEETGICQVGTPVDCPDDGLFCNGQEVCNEANDECVSMGDPCSEGETCNEDTDQCDAPFCGDGKCDLGEDCHNCPNDCEGGDGDCTDCFKGDCDGKCNPAKDGPDCPECAWCCGDGVCDPDNENPDICPIDCTCLTDADCDDGNGCTTDTCEGDVCVSEWPACGLADGCCGPDCTSAAGDLYDPDCTGPLDCSACVGGKCNGSCHWREVGTGCPDCTAQ